MFISIRLLLLVELKTDCSTTMVKLTVDLFSLVQTVNFGYQCDLLSVYPSIYVSHFVIFVYLTLFLFEIE